MALPRNVWEGALPAGRREACGAPGTCHQCVVRERASRCFSEQVLILFQSKRKGFKILVDRLHKVYMLNVRVYVFLYIYKNIFS